MLPIGRSACVRLLSKTLGKSMARAQPLNMSFCLNNSAFAAAIFFHLLDVKKLLRMIFMRNTTLDI